MRRDKQRTQTLIKKAAIAAFTEKGVEGVPFDEIARRADISRATLYNHFPTKEEMLQYLAAPILKRAIQLFEFGRINSLADAAAAFYKLWLEYSESLVLLECWQVVQLGPIRNLHNELVELTVLAFTRIDAAQTLPLGIVPSVQLVFHSYMAILKTISESTKGPVVFLSILQGMLYFTNIEK